MTTPIRITTLFALILTASQGATSAETPPVDAATFGFSPSAKPSENVAALQKALDGGHKTVTITKPGTYDLNATVYLEQPHPAQMAART